MSRLDEAQRAAARMGWWVDAVGDWRDTQSVVRVTREVNGWCRVLPDGGRQLCRSEADAIYAALEAK